MMGLTAAAAAAAAADGRGKPFNKDAIIQSVALCWALAQNWLV